jgi:hypothetical protein
MTRVSGSRAPSQSIAVVDRATVDDRAVDEHAGPAEEVPAEDGSPLQGEQGLVERHHPLVEVGFAPDALQEQIGVFAPLVGEASSRGAQVFGRARVLTPNDAETPAGRRRCCASWASVRTR